MKIARTASKTTNLVGNKNAAKDSINIFLVWTHEGKTVQRNLDFECSQKFHIIGEGRAVPRRDLAARK